jgi:hypothetical protein
MVDQKDGVTMMPRTLSRVGICELRESLAVLAKHRQRARRAAAAKEWASSSAGKAQALKAENEVARAKFEAANKPPKAKPSEPYPGTREEFFGDKKKKPAEKAGAGWDLKGKARTLAGYSLLSLGYGAHLAGGSGEPAYESAGIVSRCKLRENGRLRADHWYEGKHDPKYATEALDVIQRASKSKTELPEPSRNTLMKQERGIPAGGASKHARDLVAKQRQFIQDRLKTGENPYQQLADRAGGLRRRRWFTAKPYPKLNPPKVFSALRSVI